MNIEYRVRPVTRFIVTRFESDGNKAGCENKGEFGSYGMAWNVAQALGLQDHAREGVSVTLPEYDSTMVEQPQIPSEALG